MIRYSASRLALPGVIESGFGLRPVTHHVAVVLVQGHMCTLGLDTQVSFCVCAQPHERRRYIVTSSVIGRAHIQNDPCIQPNGSIDLKESNCILYSLVSKIFLSLLLIPLNSIYCNLHDEYIMMMVIYQLNLLVTYQDHGWIMCWWWKY